ncbi:gliding motility-associated protein GldE [Sinomicrobium soli]|uniref:gliding motility-associated protein GldE n=1 Tax=Sinomicrobium sp. N-1-3-6 TaxID=2219864 RepID=UPI000DCCC720|nr:gliding motility-associated protein GldE [Sinomicrobium sp. N-1-3-6]RAV28118.1 gliding motility-associated protein GldE [Sinomicrobium sp. N-1-3-6]
MDPEPSSFIALLSGTEGITIFKFIILVVLLCCSALISGAEVAFFSLTQTDINEEIASKSNRGTLIVKLMQKPKRLLATILVANNFINIAIVLLFSSLGQSFFGGMEQTIFGIVELRFILEVVVATALILLFGEILPKIYASRNRVRFVHLMAYPLTVLDRVLLPFSIPMKASTAFLQHKLGRQKTNLSVDQLSHALELTSESDTTREEQKILQGIVSFGNTDTKQVMCPRIDIFALSEDLKFQEVIREIVKNGYSRIPVYKDHVDNITGVLYVKDLLPHIDKKTFAWARLKREAYFVPENKKLDDLLKEFQDMKMHLAIVVDEYGGTSGLVTLEDIIEEIVGDISDEFDDEDLIFSKLDENNYVFEGKTSLKDFYRVLRLENDEALFEEKKGESETIAGLVLEIAGKFPRIREKINFHHFTFVIEALDEKRIKQIKVTIGKPRETEKTSQ